MESTEIHFRDLSRQVVENFCNNWNSDGRPCSWNFPQEYFEFESRLPQVASWLENFKTPNFQERLQKEQIYGGYYEHMDWCVWNFISEVLKKTTVEKAADIGCQNGLYPAMMLYQGVKDVTIFEPRATKYEHPGITVSNQDLTEWQDLQPTYDLITSASTIEHIGLGRYGDPIDSNGDIKMMTSIHKLLKPNGYAIISFPYNADANSPGMIVWNHHRVYNSFRKYMLFKGFKVIWEKDIGDFQPTWLLQKE